MFKHLMRSALFVPATRRDRFTRAMASGADAVVFDLEDSVAETSKGEARNAVGTFLASSISSRSLRLIRINAFGSPWIAEDVEFVRTLSQIDGVVLPKAESADQVVKIAHTLGSCAVIPLLETARGVLNSLAVASAQPYSGALMFGAEDLTAQVGASMTVDGRKMLFARSQIVLAATASGAEAIDTVFTDLSDVDELRRDAAYARALGFRGKLAIHPVQIPVLNEVFSPSQHEIESARRIVEAYEVAQATGEGVVRCENHMVDNPVVLRARHLLSLADAVRAAQASR